MQTIVYQHVFTCELAGRKTILKNPLMQGKKLLSLDMFRITRFSLVIIGSLIANFYLVSAHPPTDTLRILAIGNSFSQDAVEQYLHELAEAAGKPIVVGNMYIGGAPLSLHWENARTDKAAYSYRKIDADGAKSTEEGVSILSALADEEWDYVSLQQASPLSGQFDSYVAPLTALHRYIDSATAGRAKHIWHQTWAYAANSTHPGFANYHNDQHEMYQAIMEASAKVQQLVSIDLLVPCGTAIQNARTSFIGDRLTRDGYHLDLQIGRFIAACTWFEALFGQQAPVDRYRPEGVSVAQAAVAQQAAHAAVHQPFAVSGLASEAAALPGSDHGAASTSRQSPFSFRPGRPMEILVEWYIKNTQPSAQPRFQYACRNPMDLRPS